MINLKRIYKPHRKGTWSQTLLPLHRTQSHLISKGPVGQPSNDGMKQGFSQHWYAGKTILYDDGTCPATREWKVRERGEYWLKRRCLLSTSKGKREGMLYGERASPRISKQVNATSYLTWQSACYIPKARHSIFQFIRYDDNNSTRLAT